MFVSRETCVLVVGGGPSGMLSALLLARAGVPCVVCEQHAGISTHPKAMGVSRRTAEIYRSLDLLEKMRAQDFSTPDTQLMIWAKSLVGEELGRAPLPDPHVDFSPCAPFHSPQPHTEAVLLAALEAEPLANVCFGHRVRGLREHGPGIEVDVLTPSGPEQWMVEWAIAADGASSQVRRMLGISADGPGDLGHFLNVFFRADPGAALSGRQSILYNILREDLVEFLVSVNGRDQWLMHHFLEPGDVAENYDDDKFVGIIRSAAGLPNLPVKILGVGPWVMSPKVASKFRHGRIFLTGDAAARLSPAGGMGMNTGLQSAHNLAWKLAEVVHGNAGDGLLDTYESERLGVSQSVMRHTNEGSGEVFRQVDCAIRGDFDGLRKLLGGSMRKREDPSFDTGVHYGELVRLPHGWLHHEGRRISSLDLVGGKFVVLAGPEAQIGDGDLPEVKKPAGFENPGYPAVAGFGESGAVLVRPDGFVAWKKTVDASDDDVREALAAALR